MGVVLAETGRGNSPYSGDDVTDARERLRIPSVDLLPRALKPRSAAVTNAPQRAHAVNY